MAHVRLLNTHQANQFNWNWLDLSKAFAIVGKTRCRYGSSEPIGGRGQGGRRAPKISKIIFFLNFYWFYWFNVQHVQAYQALVPFSTWIDFNLRCDDTGFLAWLRKKIFSYVIKNLPPRNLWIGATVWIKERKQKFESCNSSHLSS